MKASHTIYSPRTHQPHHLPRVPSRIEDEIEQCKQEIGNATDDGFLVVGRVVMVLLVALACSVAYWMVTR